MDWLAENWVWMLVFAAFIGMHLFGHGGSMAVMGVAAADMAVTATVTNSAGQRTRAGRTRTGRKFIDTEEESSC